MGDGVFNLIGSACKRRWERRREFARLRDWLITLYDALLRYARRVPMPLRGRLCPVMLRDLKDPIYLRLGSSDGFVMEEIFLTQVYRPVTSADLPDVRQIVDLGANTGLSVRLWMSRYPAARVIAVEPDAGNFAACRTNVAAAGDQQVQLVQACVAARAGTVYLDRSAEECAFAMTDKKTGDPVPALTLPTILDQCNFGPVIDILKLDIEGAEREMFGDCAAWIDRVRTIMIELHPPYSTGDFLNDLDRSGLSFQVRWTGQTAGNPLLFLTRAAGAATIREVSG